MRKITLMLLSVFICININSQKIIAKANIVKPDAIFKNMIFNPADELYQDMWPKNKIHAYSDIQAPESYYVDLRKFSMPIKTDYILITSQFGYRARFKRNHNGIDLKCYTGDTIYSVFPGKVRITGYNKNGYGYYVVIRHYNGLETIYGHLSKIIIKEDEIIKEGTPIGLGGNSGRSFGSHLHLETRFLGKPINPNLIFNFKYQDITDDKFIYHKKGDS
jgi:murein DD-endopeptidase MepM/ murein hydrolase activator NlpD